MNRKRLEVAQSSNKLTPGNAKGVEARSGVMICARRGGFEPGGWKSDVRTTIEPTHERFSYGCARFIGAPHPARFEREDRGPCRPGARDLGCPERARPGRQPLGHGRPGLRRGARREHGVPRRELHVRRAANGGRRPDRCGQRGCTPRVPTGYGGRLCDCLRRVRRLVHRGTVHLCWRRRPFEPGACRTRPGGHRLESRCRRMGHGPCGGRLDGVCRRLVSLDRRPSRRGIAALDAETPPSLP